jgi:hypothetical protein
MAQSSSMRCNSAGADLGLVKILHSERRTSWPGIKGVSPPGRALPPPWEGAFAASVTRTSGGGVAP